MTYTPEHIAGTTTHVRRGAIAHKFTYGVDFVLIDPAAQAKAPALFSRNRFNLASVHDVDHGGPLAKGRGADWAHEAFERYGIASRTMDLRLLTQPRFLRYSFNPVSFWLLMQDDAIMAVIAEVSTPFGDRHSYMCHLPDLRPITKDSRITAPKALHVSPFQDVAGEYTFRFDIQPDTIAIQILHRDGDEGVVASLSGARKPLTSTGLLRASLRRPLGALRTTILIHWQALKLKLKGAKYRSRPTPPKTEIT